MFFETLKHITWKHLVKTIPIILYRPESRVVAGFYPNMAAASVLYRRNLEKQHVAGFHKFIHYCEVIE